MKKHYLLVVSLGILANGSLTWAGDFPWEMKLPFKEATIHYQLSGSEQGAETLYIKEYGKLRAKYHQGTTTIMGVSNKSETVEITDPDWVYSYDLVEKTGFKTTNPNKLYQSEYNKLSPGEKKNFVKNAKEFGTSLMGQMGGSVTRSSENYLGYECEVITVNNGMSTVYNLRGTDLPLRSEVSVMGIKNTHTATKIDTSSPVPESAFAPPAGITASHNQEAEAMTAGMIRQMVASFKDPEGGKKMQQQAAPAMTAPDMMQGMGAGALSPEEQQEMMRQMQEAMQQLQPQR